MALPSTGHPGLSEEYANSTTKELRDKL